MLNVRCQVRATLDAKGRLALPAPLRRAGLGAEVTALVMTFHGGALWAYTPAQYARTVEEPLMKLDPFAEEVKDFVHALCATDVDVDGQGRVRVPQILRELAGLKKEVMLISTMGRLEIWDREIWEGEFRQAMARKQSRNGMPRQSE